MKMAEEGLEVLKPKEAPEFPKWEATGLAATPTTYLPVRRKLRMPTDS